MQASSTDYSKIRINCNKLMLCIWWDWKHIINYELLPPDKTINSDLYCQQLMRLKQGVVKKRPESFNRKGVVFHHDNARSATQNRLREFGWEV
ncbi:Mariner Mos1 transposase [Eumeta japonica]|uniref:Mariner Mos1 transposase n=1 Tax=Eumeta variegata TaxID=151549 RepID=A0A4C1TFA9_EUMVA|nr:Mariner Mos1 transposase [Eumeta japonica]